MQKEELRYGEDYKFIPAISFASGTSVEVLPDLYCHTIQAGGIAAKSGHYRTWSASVRGKTAGRISEASAQV